MVRYKNWSTVQYLYCTEQKQDILKDKIAF